MKLSSIATGLLLCLCVIQESQQQEEKRLRKRRSIIMKQEKYRWPDNVVRYYFATRDPARISAVQIVQAEIEARTCIKFQRVSRNYRGYKIAVTFKPNRGCFTYSGYLGERYREKILNLGNGCNTLSTTRHEWQHVLGVLHMQSSFDRDDYITFHPENLSDRSKLRQFRKVKKANFSHMGGRYDFRSVMHYRSDSRAKKGTNTMVALKKSDMPMIDHRRSPHLSFYDFNTINKAYKCGERCGKKSCSGYVDKNCKCVTPDDPIFGGNSFTNLKWPPKVKYNYKPKRDIKLASQVIHGKVPVVRVKSEIPGQTYQPNAGKSFSNCRKYIDVYYEKTSNYFFVALKRNRAPAGCYIDTKYLSPKKTYKKGRLSWKLDEFRRIWVIFYNPGFKPKVVSE